MTLSKMTIPTTKKMTIVNKLLEKKTLANLIKT